MEAHSRMRLGREAPVNSFLLCTVLAKQTRRLGRLMPDRGIPELITIAMKNCADYELVLELGPGVPVVVRDKAMQIGRITRRAEPSVASGPGHSEGSWFRDAVSAAAQAAGDREPTGEASLPGESSMGAHLFVGGSVDASDSSSRFIWRSKETLNEQFQWCGSNSSPAIASDGREPVHAGEPASRKSQLRRGPCSVWPCFDHSARDPHSRERWEQSRDPNPSRPASRLRNAALWRE